MNSEIVRLDYGHAPELELVGGHEAKDGGGEAPLLVADNLPVGRVVIRARAGLQQSPGQLPRLAVDVILIPEPTSILCRICVLR